MVYKYSCPEADHVAWSHDQETDEAWDNAWHEAAEQLAYEAVEQLVAFDKCTILHKEWTLDELQCEFCSDALADYWSEGKFSLKATTEEERAEQYTQLRTYLLDDIKQHLFNAFDKGIFKRATEIQMEPDYDC
jgi:hypothetical protein